jgi:hypothetical protein
MDALVAYRQPRPPCSMSRTRRSGAAHGKSDFKPTSVSSVSYMTRLAYTRERHIVISPERQLAALKRACGCRRALRVSADAV